MSDNKHTLKNRFDNFEPEVDETVIDKNWQVLSQHLSSDKATKRKFGFWFSISLIAVLLGVSAIIATYSLYNTNNSSSNSSAAAYQESKTEYTNLQNTNNNPSENEISNNTQTNIHSENSSSTKNAEVITTHSNSTDILKNSDSKKPSQQTVDNINIVAKTAKNSREVTSKSNLQNLSFSKKSNPINTKSTCISSNNQLLDNTLKDLTNKSEEETENENSVATKNNNVLNPALTSIQDEAKNIENNFMLLSSIPIFFYDSIANHDIYASLNIISADNQTDNPAEIKHQKISIDIMGGAAFNQNKMTQNLNTTVIGLNSKNLNFSGGIGINYHISDKLTASIDYNYASNKMSHSTADDKIIEVAKYTSNYQNISDSSYQKDVIEKQLNYKQSYSLSSNQSHLIGLGLSYNIINNSKWIIAPGISLHAKINRFSYSKQAALNTNDTINISFLNQPSTDSTTYSSLVTYPTADYKSIDYTVKNDFKTSLGVSPSLMLGYNINNKIQTFIKASYYYDLKPNKITNNELEYKIKQNILFAHFGIRIKL